jgi:ATP phosphoribosyltransferase
MLSLAIPSKGRLQEQVSEYFADAGLPIKKSGTRGYSATIQGQPDIDVRLLSASEISSALLEGDIQMGVTGEDLLRRSSPSLKAGLAHSTARLRFRQRRCGGAGGLIDVSTMHDLDDVCAAFAQRHKRRLRIATKYVHLTRAFFARHGIADYRIVEVSGARRRAGLRLGGGDRRHITTTGATLAANGLKVLEDGTMLESQAQLAASLTAGWTSADRSTAEVLLSRIAAREKAKSSQVIRVRMNGKTGDVLAALNSIGAAVLSQSGGEYSLVCPREKLMAAMTILKADGAGAASVEDADYLFEPENALFAKLSATLPQA